jgi:branched-chain amino acid aminotransferase
MKSYCYIDGQIKKLNQAMLPVTDLSILRGFGVFDFLRIYNQKPFRLADHFDRLINSAKLMNLDVPVSLDDLDKIIKNLLVKNKLTEASIKIVLTGGESDDGISLKSQTSHFFILMDDLCDLPSSVFKKGAKLITYNHQRVIPGAKNSNYIPAVLMQTKKKKAGAVEILYTDNDLVLECATSNFFIVKAGVLVTPKNNVLKGITRKIVLEIAKKNKIKIEERDVLVSEIKTADEIFITATNKFICPIVMIDKNKIGDGKVGLISVKLLNLYKDYIAEVCK